MAGHLAAHLQELMLESPPRGWRAIDREVAVLPPHLSAGLGYAPAADLVIESKADGRRIWIELEISRADPVANHAKFAVAHMIRPVTGTFVAMMSPHISSGRRRLAAHAVSMMRRMSMDAFQTPLFPQLTGIEIKRLNHMPAADLKTVCPPIEPEWQRVLAVVKPVVNESGHRIHFVGDPAEVRWNIFRWNVAVATPAGRELWGGKRGHRVVQHFVCAPKEQHFAPSKYAAFVPCDGGMGMSMEMYARLDESESRFDGHLAWRHLERIGFARSEDSKVRRAFDEWLGRRDDVVKVRRGGPVIWVPPRWAW